jgi:hypothetical protein
MMNDFNRFVSQFPDEFSSCFFINIKIPLQTFALFAWLISHQLAVLFSHNKPATNNQPTVLFSQKRPAPAISHQPTEQADSSLISSVFDFMN